VREFRDSKAYVRVTARFSAAVKTQPIGAGVKSHSSNSEIRHPSQSATAQLMNANSAENHKIPEAENIPGSEVMTLQQLSTYLCIPRSTIYRLVQRGCLPAFKVGRQWRVRLELVQNYLVKNYERKTGRSG
jgi:excisionase family DNA binding protein